MQWTATVTSQPAAEPVVLGEIKRQLAITHKEDDDLIRSLIKRARFHVEKETDRRLVTQTVVFYYDHFPRAVSPPSGHYLARSSGRAFRIPWRPVRSIGSVEYQDFTLAWTTIPSQYYVVKADEELCSISETFNWVWPPEAPQRACVRITAVLGYGDTGASVPEDLRGVIMNIACSMYLFRESESVDDPTRLRYVDEILDHYRNRQYC